MTTTDDPAGERRDAAQFMEKIGKLNAQLAEENAPALPPPDADGRVVNKRTAMAYKIKLMFFARNHFARDELQDITHAHWFEDADGHRIDEAEWQTWPFWRLDRAIRSGNFNVRHERDVDAEYRIGRTIRELGHTDALPPDVNDLLDAAEILREKGIPRQ